MHLLRASMAQPLRKYAEWETASSRDLVETDRRRRSRMQVHWHVSFSDSGTSGALECFTHDLSSDGFYCVARAALIPGEIRNCILEIPMHHKYGGERLVRIHCKVRVIRVTALVESGTYGIGCRIEDYRFGTRELANRAVADQFDGMAV